MKIDRIIYPITSLGPGERIAIWTVGCSKHCDNCASRELWSFNDNKEIDVDELIFSIKQQFKNKNVDGITITGGDPLEQATELLKLLKGLRELTDDILVYTGYEYSEINSIYPRSVIEELKSCISVLIDGRYIDQLNDNTSALKGSSNQEIIFFDNDKVEKYKSYINEGRKIQNVYYNDYLMSVGIHNKEEVFDE